MSSAGGAPLPAVRLPAPPPAAPPLIDPVLDAMFRGWAAAANAPLPLPVASVAALPLSVAAPSATAKAGTFTLKLEGQLDKFSPQAEETMLARLAAHGGVHPSQLVVLSRRAGSVILEVAVMHSADEPLAAASFLRAVQAASTEELSKAIGVPVLAVHCEFVNTEPASEATEVTAAAATAATASAARVAAVPLPSPLAVSGVVSGVNEQRRSAALSVESPKLETTLVSRGPVASSRAEPARPLAPSSEAPISALAPGLEAPISALAPSSEAPISALAPSSEAPIAPLSSACPGMAAYLSNHAASPPQPAGARAGAAASTSLHPSSPLLGAPSRDLPPRPTGSRTATTAGGGSAATAAPTLAVIGTVAAAAPFTYSPSSLIHPSTWPAAGGAGAATGRGSFVSHARDGAGAATGRGSFVNHARDGASLALVADAPPSVPDAAAPAPADLAAVDAADPAAAASAPDRLGEGNGPAAPDERAPSRAHALLTSTDTQRSPNGSLTVAATETQALRRRQQRLYVRIVILFGALLLVFSMVLATVARHLEPGAVPSAAFSWARANLEHVDAATVATAGREAAADDERAPSARHGARATARTHATSGGSDARGQSGRRAPKQVPPSPKPTPPPSRPPPPSQPPPQPQRPPTQPQQPQARASEGTAKAQQPTPAESGRPAASPREASARDGAGRPSPSTGERNGFTEAFPRRRLLRTARVLLSDMRTWYSWSL
mgnify:CR=1 FL=1